VRRRDDVRNRARTTLRAEWRRTPDARAATDIARRHAPRLFAASVWPAEADELLHGMRTEGPGWWARRRRRRSAARLRRLAGTPSEVPDDAMLAAVELARPDAPVPPELTPSHAAADLLRAEDEVRSRLTAWLSLETRSEDRLDRAGLAAVSTLATALRSGRSARRAQLERLRDRSLVRALPLWMGTLGDVDDLLPPVPALFDLVLVDEASATEQTAAASALLRGRRAAIVGDPRQLRHVSFLSDETITAAHDRHGIDPARRSQLDVRRNSLFDAAAAASPVLMLDEHFRSAPHLIDVVARTVYGGQLHVATRTPMSDRVDCVSLTRTDGTREKGGIVQAEIDAVLHSMRAMRHLARSVGVVTPFRAQADALEAAILASFGADELVRMGVRVGTVHSFQGNERDRVVCSVGLVDGDAAGWAFVGDPHLLAVMLTRARTSMTVVSSCNPDPDSLLGQYFATADSPPGPPPPAARLSAWATGIADDLELAGVTFSSAYPTGRHVVDIATVAEHRPLGILCDLHPEGIDAHIDRLVDLQRAGWQTLDALASSWDDRRGEMVADLARYLHAEA
jgi:hypothetical protein